jgi:hypothetical protein
MPDQDEFAPLAKSWKPIHEMYLMKQQLQNVADEAFRTLREMLHECGGCPVLPDLQTLLQEFADEVWKRETVGWQITGDAEQKLDAALENLLHTIDNRRIDAVAIRSCRTAAVDIACGIMKSPLGPKLATLVACHLLCHFVLDRARAMAVGGQHTEAEARETHRQIIEFLMPSLVRLGELWIKHPDAQFTMHVRLASQIGTLDILEHEDQYRLD